MSGWVIFVGLCIAAFVGALLERAFLVEIGTSKLKDLEAAYVEEINRCRKVANEAWRRKEKYEEHVTADRVLHELQVEVTHEETKPDMFQYAPGQDPRD